MGFKPKTFESQGEFSTTVLHQLFKGSVLSSLSFNEASDLWSSSDGFARGLQISRQKVQQGVSASATMAAKRIIYCQVLRQKNPICLMARKMKNLVPLL